MALVDVVSSCLRLHRHVAEHNGEAHASLLILFPVPVPSRVTFSRRSTSLNALTHACETGTPAESCRPATYFCLVRRVIQQVLPDDPVLTLRLSNGFSATLISKQLRENAGLGKFPIKAIKIKESRGE